MIVLAYRALGAGFAIAIMEWLGPLTGEPISRVPFVTSIVLVMAVPTSPVAHPRAIIGGHLLASFCGLLCQSLIGPGEVASSVAVALATFLMVVLQVIHPPAGIDAFLMPAFDLPAKWILNPVLVGAVLLAVFAGVWNKGERWVVIRMRLKGIIQG